MTKSELIEIITAKQKHLPARDVELALAAKDRTRAGPTAPPMGLCLMEVQYDEALRGGSAGQRRDAEEPGDDE